MERTKDVPGISLVVPVYNVQEYLPECLDSLLGQSFAAIEIILVDDGSTDASAEICDRYAARDGRIRVVHQQNAGVSKARTSGSVSPAVNIWDSSTATIGSTGIIASGCMKR